MDNKTFRNGNSALHHTWKLNIIVTDHSFGYSMLANGINLESFIPLLIFFFLKIYIMLYFLIYSLYIPISRPVLYSLFSRLNCTPHLLTLEHHNCMFKLWPWFGHHSKHYLRARKYLIIIIIIIFLSLKREKKLELAFGSKLRRWITLLHKCFPICIK